MNLTNVQNTFNVSRLQLTKTAQTPTFCGLNPMPFDSFQSTQKANTIFNKRLLNEYGIEANISDMPFLIRFLGVVDKFSEINENKDLFQGLKIEFDDIPIEEFFRTDFNAEKPTILFSKDIVSSELWDVMEELYDAGKIASDNPNYKFYEALGDYLNYKADPERQEFYAKEDSVFLNDGVSLPLHLTDSINVGKFNRNFIAAKMCGVKLPSAFDDDFYKTTKNTQIKFPQSRFEFLKGAELDFKTTEEVNEFLKEYGIEGEFPNLQSANDFASCVVDLSKAANDTQIFSGLKVELAGSDLDPDVRAQLTSNMFNMDDAVIQINPNSDWENYQEMCDEDYEDFWFPVNSRKYAYTHELAHFLDNKNKPMYKVMLDEFYKSGDKSLNDYQKMIVSKVSMYSETSPAEFCADYVAARMAGVSYPFCVDAEFAKFWDGPELEFPN